MSLSQISLTVTELRAQLRRIPRLSLAQLPTPLEHCERLSKEIGINLFIKRDDCTGLGFGGNKVRQLEFTLADAVRAGADCIVQGAGSQSNHCRQAAAAAAKLGLDCHLALKKDAHSAGVQGNVLLDHLFGAHVEFVDAPMGSGIYQAKERIAQRLRDQGRRPYILNPPKALSLGAVAFVEAFVEMLEQAKEQNLAIERLFVCSCGATGAGLLLANKALQVGIPITCVAPILWEWPTGDRLAEAANLAAEEIGIPVRLDPKEIDFTDAFVAPGYGIPSEAGNQAMRLVARTEGLALDPVYTAKAFAALLEAARGGKVPKGATVVFWHTGGTPALFAYQKELAEDQMK